MLRERSDNCGTWEKIDAERRVQYLHTQRKGASALQIQRPLRGILQYCLAVALLLAVAVLPSTFAEGATGPVTVSLTFDDNFLNQYTLGYLNALKPHQVSGTFFINSGIIGSSNSKLTWNQLTDMASNGDEIGGKTVDGVNLTNIGAAAATSEVCNDRQALVAHGITDPTSFAYPSGANNSSVQSIVASCGYGSARTGGSLSPSGPRYSGPNPPDNYYAIRAWAPSSQITLAQLESIVSNAANNSGQGRWVPIMIQRVCDQALDPSNYSSCRSGAWIQLADLNAFLTWVQNSGQSGGAPQGTTFRSLGAVLTASDTSAPITSIACNGAPCSDQVYGSNVTATMSATDAGSGVSSTHYTLDGSTPTLSSPTYTGAVTLSATTTVEYRSWDNAGNVEATKTQIVQMGAPPDTTPPVTAIACNDTSCMSSAYAGGVSVSLNAVDNPGGSGVGATRYTTDGTDPTTSGTAETYTGPFLVAGNTFVRYFSTDLAGNSEGVKTQQINANPFPLAVSLTFDDQYENQWRYVHPLLQEFNMQATFYVITGDTDAGYSGFMSWNQLDTLASEGNDIGGHGVAHLDLTDPTNTYAQKVADVCGSFIDLVSNGISNPVSYAYPFGDYDATAESIVQSCGFHSSRAAGGISSSVSTPSAPWVETIPPRDPYAIRAIDVDGSGTPQLADLENFVLAAAIHGGGWLPMIFHQVCDQATSDYGTCMGQYGIQDTVLAQLMTWLSNAGQPGGAPAGTTVRTQSQLIP